MRIKKVAVGNRRFGSLKIVVGSFDLINWFN